MNTCFNVITFNTNKLVFTVCKTLFKDKIKDAVRLFLLCIKIPCIYK